MCEWLSHGEWCDVQLLCGGRSFSAHRAVLASVSNFLRHILLSCSDETTTFIVLPDFDLEAMSYVLYYIYNGEVVMKKQKLSLFLDIIRAMQIHIDYRYLPETQNNEYKKINEFKEHLENNSLCDEIFTLALNSDTDQNIFNIKRCEETQITLLKYSQSDSDLLDTTVRCQNESEPGKSRLGNLKSPYESRQRNSLLRDLFIETYPRNGNVNGLSESVQAISNECYHSPGSVLLANVNRRHLSIDGPHTPLPLEASGHSSHSPVVDESQLSTYDINKDCAERLMSNTTNPQFHKSSAGDISIDYSQSEIFIGVDKTPREKNQTILGSFNENKINESFDINTFVIKNLNNYGKINTLLKDSSSKNLSKVKEFNMKTKNSSRVIFNHVLESPWHTRKPNNYRPFRRKDEHLEHGTEFLNDTNNNLQNSTNPSEIVSEKKRSIEISRPVENRESFKCSHCDQVFTSSEALVVHMRRHSAVARYSCGECGKTFSQLRNFKYHMSIHRGTREFAATCSVCGKYFNDRGYLSSHMKIHRNRKEYKCSLCPKSFNQRVAYNMHVRIHTGVKPHICEECGKAFSRKMLLKQHQRTHSGERPYACPHCDKRFADRSNMTLHLRLHTGVKPFSCPMCPKSFTKKHHLKSHLNFHTGSKPYSCPRCNLAFTQSSNMRTHYKKCNAPEPSTSNGSLSSIIVPTV